MKAPLIPANDPARVQALEDLEILYSPAEERFDRITRIARRIFDVPIVLVSLVSKDKQWFKSCQGLTASETSREISFCGHAILTDDVFVVPNALKDPDFSDNPLVTGEPKIRFYAGQPLNFAGHRLGTLCLIDQRPRQLKPQDYDSLECLAGWVELELLAWRNDESTFLQQILKLEERESLLDPVTGDLNESGVSLVKDKLEEIDTESAEPLQILVEVSNMPSGLQQGSLDLLRKYVSQSVRAAVKDRGIIGQKGISGFTVILSNSTREEADEMMGEIDQKLVEFIGDEFELTFIKPEIALKLETLKSEVGDAT